MIFKRAIFIILSLIAVNAEAQLIDTLIDVSPYTLHFRILKGKNLPILFESGGGMDASQWDSIATVLHHRLQATVITYDRAGFGKSTLDTANYTILQEIKSLEVALGNFGYGNADFLVVGHSLGGFYNRVFAGRHPEQVKGIVLLDPRIPSYEDMSFARNYFKSLDRKDYEPDDISLYHLLANMERNSNYVRQVPLPSEIPILNIMAEKGPFTEVQENERFQADQRSFVKAAKNRKLVLAKGSSHNIPYDKPGLVIELITNFYQKLRN
ncbi:alpha/beta hydrolase [Dyadobacter sp. LHD-138]|uniref:alpha/beta fold hydrolase n=1 Tax=Dyadobacter sp. LHD-138 TaxID=3071413 RepID=UPI0027E03E63|nr:alpha/beta hydrolase [Dyadobacter sp. LHD-138]MDQ6479438.1 alpha/beta hydrolase [Dyadobacter sp. LHD-138]